MEVKPLNRAGDISTEAILLVLLLVVAGLGGIVSGTGDVRIVTVIAGAVVGMFLLVKPALALYSAIVGSLMVVGVIQLYFPQLQLVRWSVAVLASALGGLAIVDRLLALRSAPGRQVGSLIVWSTVLIVVALWSSFMNFGNFETFAFGFKGYFQVWGLVFAIALMGWRESTIDALPKILIAIGLLQLPFVVHQFLFIVPTRIGLGGGIVAEDVVAGTMGANAEGGGANAALSLLVIISMSILAGMYRRGLISPIRLALAGIVLLLPVFLNANKGAIVYIIVAYVMLFWGEIRTNAVRTIVIGTLAASVVFGILWTYANLLPRAERSEGVQDLIVASLIQNVDESEGFGNYELNRWTSITFWIDEHRSGELQRVLWGHGMGSSRDGQGAVTGVDTLALWEYAGMGIGLTGLAAILWELGVLGVFVFAGLFASAFIAAGRLARAHISNPFRSSVFYAFQVGIVLFAASIILKNMIVHYLPYQALLALLIGYIAFWQSRPARAVELR